jgi:hypothetical protein
MTVDESIRQQVKDEIGDIEDFPQPQKFMLLQKFGIAKPVMDKTLKNPGWVPETSTNEGDDTWKKRLKVWIYTINQLYPQKRHTRA